MLLDTVLEEYGKLLLLLLCELGAVHVHANLYAPWNCQVL